MKTKLSIFLLISIFLGVFWIGCQEEITQTEDPLSSIGQLEKKPGPCPPDIDLRVNTGTALECGTAQFTLWAGQNNETGTITISNDDDNLYVTYTTDGSVDLEEVHVYVWTDGAEVPCKRPAPGHADYVKEGINANEYTVEIPLGEGIECDSEVYIAAHAALSDGETAYGGDNPAVPGNNGGAWFYVDKYTICCCEPIPAGSATYYSDLSTSVVSGNVPDATYPHAAVYVHKPGFAPVAPSTWYSPYGQVWDQTHDGNFSSNAEWIWESYEVVNPHLGDVIELQKEFNIPGTPAGGSLKIACDNGFAVELNGTLVGSLNLFKYPDLGDLKQPFVNTTNWQTLGTYDLTPYLVTGTNTLKVIAVNEYLGPEDVNEKGASQLDAIYTDDKDGDKTKNRNPGGVIFEFDVSWEGIDCP